MGATKAGTLTRRLSTFFPFISMKEADVTSITPPPDQQLPLTPPLETTPPSLPQSDKMSGKLSKNPRGHHSAVSLAGPSSNHHPPVPYMQSPTFSNQNNVLPLPPPIHDVSGRSFRTGSSSAPGSPVQRPYHSNLSVPDLTKIDSHSPPQKKKKSWVSGLFKSSSKEHNLIPEAWILGHQGKLSYDLSALLNGQPVPELWDERGDTFIYLFPATSHKGPSFRVQSSLYAASRALSMLAHGRASSVGSESAAGSEYRMHQSYSHSRNFSHHAGSLSTPPLTPEQRPPSSRDMYKRMSGLELSPSHEMHLHMPLTLSSDSGTYTTGDVHILVAVRNLFAFLLGQSLVGTDERGNIFSVFMKIAEMLNGYDFSNLDGSTFGDVAANSFDRYVVELGIADVRVSREKTIEGLVLGEHMRSVLLYNEAFVHAAGKYDELTDLKSLIFSLVSSMTRARLERANLDLNSRLNILKTKLDNFEFPAIFSGIMNSKTADERKEVNFAEWRNSFMMMRKFTMNYYRQRFGAWPPKASSKKNDLETSGLNRLVVRELYYDLVSLYNLFVDRRDMTHRTIGAPVDDSSDTGEPEARVIRRVLDEYDRSTPPVQPPIPFDVPLLPTLATIRPDYGHDAKKDAKAQSKKLKGEETFRILRGAYNEDADIQTPFLDAFRKAEHSAAHGSKIADARNLRVGQWIFLYAVLQSLPMLVVDAPQVRYIDGVEYFLCAPPRAGVPWARPDDRASSQRSWYGVPGSSGAVVSLPSDVLEFSVEGIYQRSHCWVMAQKWAAQAGLAPPLPLTSGSTLTGSPVSAAHSGVRRSLDRLAPPPGRGPVGGRTHMDPWAAEYGSGHGQFGQRHSSLGAGLEPVPAAAMSPEMVASSPRRTIEVNPAKTFDAIIESMDNQKDKKKKR